MSRRAQGEGSLFQRGDGYWCASVRLPSGQRVTRYGKTKKDAAAALAELTKRRTAGQLAAPSKVTVGEWCDTWFASHRQRLRPTTQRNYAGTLRRDIQPVLGPLRLSRLTPLLAQGLVDEVGAEHPHQAAVVRIVLHEACARAVEMGLLGRNPVADVRVPVPARVERTVWGPEEVRCFRASAAGSRDAALWDVLLGGGLRIGEALGAEWADLDLDAGTLRVVRTLSYLGGDGYRLGPPKTRAGVRRVALPTWAIASLRAWRARQAEERLRAGPDWADVRSAVFLAITGKPLSPGSLRRRFRAACDRAHVPPLRVHDLRHVHASLAIAGGGDPKAVQQRLGHSTVDETLRVYAHAMVGSDRRIVAHLDRLA